MPRRRRGPSDARAESSLVSALSVFGRCATATARPSERDRTTVNNSNAPEAIGVKLFDKQTADELCMKLFETNDVPPSSVEAPVGKTRVKTPRAPLQPFPSPVERFQPTSVCPRLSVGIAHTFRTKHLPRERILLIIRNPSESSAPAAVSRRSANFINSSKCKFKNDYKKNKDENRTARRRPPGELLRENVFLVPGKFRRSSGRRGGRFRPPVRRLLSDGRRRPRGVAADTHRPRRSRLKKRRKIRIEARRLWLSLICTSVMDIRLSALLPKAMFLVQCSQE
ncbi:hypothetical protein EVAR_4725_1 [Eumeta japonica]|uniref:Uncharacterized protein n=1 Tax=Eumeta variegata TaxID=151549 RepID=A0A4C1SYQ4_EUMVA|nr:hypothetical protein EVAR_4725_1 [Eumeta japonica]